VFGFIKKRFLHRFILVEIQDILVSIHTYDVKNNKILSQVSEDFTLESKDEFTEEVVEYINKKQNDYVRSYVATLINSQGQGIIPTCSSSKFKEFSIDRRYIYNLCIDKSFTNFVSRIEVSWIQKLFTKTGIDLIFSPFAILKELIDKQNYKDKMTLYILYYNQTVVLMVKSDIGYIYGDFFLTTSMINPLYCDYENEEDEEEFEIDEEEFDFGDEFETSQEVDTKEVELIEENKGFTANLSNSLKDFYTSNKYDSSFIENVFIFVNTDLDQSIIRYIEDELLLSTTVKYIDMDESIINLCQKEVIGV